MVEHFWPMILEGGFILVALGVSAFFSGSEVALTSISAARITRITGHENDGHPLSDWLENPGKYLTTLLVGNNITNIAATILAGDLSRRVVLTVGGAELASGPIPGAVAFVVMTFMVLVFGEILPKVYFRQHHESMAPKVVGPILRLYTLLNYPIRCLIWIANGFIRLFGGEPAPDVGFVTADDLKVLIEVGQKQGMLEEGEREMLHSIFELSETPIREVMTPRISMIYVNVNDDLHRVLETFEEHDFSRLPVIQDNRDNVVGILYMKDLLHRWRSEETNGDLVRSLMRPPLFVPESKRVDDLLEQFQKEKTHIAIVVDEYGGTGGLVTIEDLLEEIVGEIEDEFDQEEEPVVAEADGAWVAEASISLDDLAHAVGVDWSEKGAFESLGGLLLETHGDLPKTGETMDLNGFRFTILEADERRIDKVRIQKLDDAPEPELETQEG